MGKEVNFLFLFLILFSIGLVSATELPPQQVGTDIEIYQECWNCTYCNFTTFKAPNGTNLLTNMVATQSDTHYSYLINSGNITKQGTYRYCYKCGNNADAETGCIDVPVNYTGSKLDLPQTIMYLAILSFLVGLLFYIIYLYPKLPRNPTNEDGMVIGVSSLAYLRPVALGFMWIILLSITFIVANISVAYIAVGFLGSFIFGIWHIMMLANLLIVPLYVIYLINNAIKQGKLKEFIERGGIDFS